jgi:hypothetical protein
MREINLDVSEGILENGGFGIIRRDHQRLEIRELLVQALPTACLSLCGDSVCWCGVRARNLIHASVKHIKKTVVLRSVREKLVRADREERSRRLLTSLCFCRRRLPHGLNASFGLFDPFSLSYKGAVKAEGPNCM